jgi:hypothetical protein
MSSEETNISDKSKMMDFVFESLILNQEGYHISFERACSVLNASDTYNKFYNPGCFRASFKARVLRKSTYLLDEAENELDLDQDLIMRVGRTHSAEFPWFSTNGFKRFCLAFNTQRSKYVYEYFTHVEALYYESIKQAKEENKIKFDKFIALTKKISEFDEKLFLNERRSKCLEVSRIFLGRTTTHRRSCRIQERSEGENSENSEDECYDEKMRFITQRDKDVIELSRIKQKIKDLIQFDPIIDMDIDDDDDVSSTTAED